MTAVFADTFYWVAITNPADFHYQRAIAMQDLIGDAPVVTTDEVLVEYLTYFAEIAWLRLAATSLTRRLLKNPNVRIIPQDRNTFLAGLALYESRPDKRYSLTDCISMETMRREGLTDALPNDRHFEQEGFRTLFR